MARRKDLTALAALGTLGYMLSKKGDKTSDKKDEKSTSDAAERRRAADKEASEEPLKIGSELGMDPEEAANRRTERMLTNPNAREFGEAGTSMTVSPTKKPVARRPVVKSRPMSAAAEAAFQEANAAPSGSKYTSTKDFMGMGQMARKSPYVYDEHQGGVHADAGYGSKRGGLLKAKKMASGGMTSSSASKRADGIATKGKTKCKMY
jgi:hypothetical protein